MAPRARTIKYRPRLASRRRASSRAAAIAVRCLLLTSTTSAVFMRTESSLAEPSTTRAVLELELNGTRFGDVIVLLSKDDVLVPELALRKAGVLKLRSRPIRYQGIDYYSLRRSEPHLRFAVNELDLVLEVTAPPSALASATVDLSEPAPTGMWQSDEPSASLTYAPSLNDFKLFRMYADASATGGPFRASTTSSYELGNAPVRLMSQAVYADRQNVREVIVGDNYVNTGALGGSTL